NRPLRGCASRRSARVARRARARAGRASSTTSSSPGRCRRRPWRSSPPPPRAAPTLACGPSCASPAPRASTRPPPTPPPRPRPPAGPAGGLHLWLALPDGTDDVAVSAAAAAEGVVVFPGRPWFPAEPPAPFLRLTYAAAAPEAMDEGARRLARALTR